MLEIICNLVTAILHKDEWDPMTLFGRNQHLVPPPNRLDKDIPFGEGRELIVDIEVDPRGMNDIYSDDIVLLTVKIKGTDNLVRCDRAPLHLSCLTRARDLRPKQNQSHERQWKPETSSNLKPY